MPRTNATATRAAHTVQQAINSIDLPLSGIQEQEQPLSSLAALPSYLFISLLGNLFANPENAFQRGEFQRIKAQALDLPPPRKTPDPQQHRLWAAHLPKPVEDLFTKDFHSNLVQPLMEYKAAQKQEHRLPQPRIHASPEEYLKLLHRAEMSGMLTWSIVSEEEETYSNFADSIQLTLFAVSKSDTRSRLISWPRVQNAALPDPPHTSLPNPTMFEAIEVNGANPSAFYLDIANMFHNLTLPTWLAKLFPMQVVQLRDLDSEAVSRIAKKLPQLKAQANALVRPCQATMPMGFKWAVFIAHSFVNGCLRQAYALFRASRLVPKHVRLQEAQTLCAEHIPIRLTESRPLFLHIIDDVTVVTVGWKNKAVQHLHKITRRVLAVHGLPVRENKSCEPSHVENRCVDFIGCRWDLSAMKIEPVPGKLASAISQAYQVLKADVTQILEREKLVGRLIWFATLNRPLLACMQRVFSHTRREERNQVAEITLACKQELTNLVSLLPMATVQIGMPISTWLFAFDASLQAGAVTRSLVEPQLAHDLWTQAQTVRHSKAVPPNYEIPAVMRAAQTYTWTRIVSHRWLREEHINALEAAASVLALECAVRAGLRHTRVLLLTDSLVVLGALQKGRSSSPPLLARCRRFAALALAHDLKITLAYVRSENNPADRYTREETHCAAQNM